MRKCETIPEIEIPEVQEKTNNPPERRMQRNDRRNRQNETRQRKRERE
jgi:hypothetical protein